MEKAKRATIVRMAGEGYKVAGSHFGEEGRLGVEFFSRADFNDIDKWIVTTSLAESETDSRRMERIFRKASEEAKAPRTLAKEFLTVGLAQNRPRANMLARTGVHWAHNQGAQIRYAREGVTVKEWMTVFDDLTCPHCANMNGRQTRIHDSFLPQGHPYGVEVDGKERWMTKGLTFDIEHPPLHPNCRCVLVPTFDMSAIPARELPLKKYVKLRGALPEPEEKISKLKVEREKLLGLPSPKVTMKRKDIASQISEIEEIAKTAPENAGQRIRDIISHNRKGPKVSPDAFKWVRSKGQPAFTSDHKHSVEFGVGSILDHLSTESWTSVWMNRLKRMEITSVKGDLRGFHRGYRISVPVSWRATSTAIHEMGHHLESIHPGIRKKARAFLQKRTKGQNLESLSDAARSSGYARGEKCIKDRFFSPYVGKIYDGGDTEIVSMGMEKFFGAPIAFYKADPEHFRLIVEILMGKY